MLTFTSGAGFIPSRMTKTGSQNLGTDFLVIQGWTADPAYPGSTVSGNQALVSQSSGTAAVSAAVGFSASGSITVTANLTVNGTVVATNAATAASGTVNLAWNGALAAGGLVRVEAKSNTLIGGPNVSSGSVQIQ